MNKIIFKQQVYHKITLALFMSFFFFSQSNAKDASDMDIQGISLGMSLDEVKKKMPCLSEIITVEEYGFVEQIVVYCKDTNRKDHTSVTLDKNGKVFQVVRHKVFAREPDWEIIKSKLIEKYKRPNVSAITKSLKHRFRGSYTMRKCWGISCSKKKLINNYWAGETLHSDQRSLIITMSVDKDQKQENRFTINFNLLDKVAETTNRVWVKSERLRLKESLRKKESDIKL